MYSFNSVVRFSEVDHNKMLTLPGIINYFQDCSIFHSESLGAGMENLENQKKGWILSSWQIIVNRYPQMGEKIEIGTWPTSFKGLYGTRNFVLKDEQGEMLAYANSIWVFMDFGKGRPTKPDEELIAKYQNEPPLEMEYAPRKIELPEQAEAVGEFTVRKYQIDTNEHMNNGHYVQLALESMKTEKRVREVRVEYKKSAVYKDVIVPKIAEEEERTVVTLCDTQDKPYAIIELIGEV